MNLPAFIARRITFQSERTFSRLSVRIAIVGIMLSLAVMILSLAIMKGFKGEIREKVRGFSGDIIIQKFNLDASLENSSININPDTLKNLRSLKGIEYLQPVAHKPGIIIADNEIEGVVLKGVDKTYNWSFFNKILVSGKVIDFSDSIQASRQILLSNYTAQRLNLKTGDDFLMFFVDQGKKRKFTIAGIYNLGVEDVDKMYVIGDLSLIQRLNKWETTQVGGYEMRVKDFGQLESTAARVNEELNMRDKAQTVIDYFPTIFQWLGLLDVNAEVILVLMIAVAVINMVSALLIIILERTNMIGILKALGNSNWAIQKIFLYNAVYLIGIGLLWGNMLGISLALFQQYTHFFSLDQSSYYVSFIPVQLDVADIILLNAGTLLVCLLVLLLPSAVVSRISPVRAIAFK